MRAQIEREKSMLRFGKRMIFERADKIDNLVFADDWRDVLGDWSDALCSVHGGGRRRGTCLSKWNRERAPCENDKRVE